jgi:diguanylate cyclase (GGDEF)-like protein
MHENKEFTNLNISDGKAFCIVDNNMKVLFKSSHFFEDLKRGELIDKILKYDFNIEEMAYKECQFDCEVRINQEYLKTTCQTVPQGDNILMIFLLDNKIYGMTDEISKDEIFDAIVNNTIDVISIYNFNKKRFTYFSPSIMNLRGITQLEALNQTMEECLCEESLVKVIKIMKEGYESFIENPHLTHSYTLEIRQPDKNRVFKWIELTVKFRYNKIGEVETVGVSREIENRKKVEKELEKKNYYLSLLNKFSIEQSSAKSYDDIVNILMDQIYLFSNGIATVFSEYDSIKKALITKKINSDMKIVNIMKNLTFDNIIKVPVPIDDYYHEMLLKQTVKVMDNLTDATSGMISKEISKVFEFLSGINAYIGFSYVVENKVYGTSLIALNSDNNIPPMDFLESFSQMSAISLLRLKAQERITHLGYHDSLTSLYNRHYLTENYDALNDYILMPQSVIVADINGLKLVNDTYGHKIGDELIVSASNIIKTECPNDAMVIRNGGDEFLIIMNKASNYKAQAILKKITKKAMETLIAEIPVSIALGLSTRQNLNKDLNKILYEAETEMYKKKLTESRSIKNLVLQTLKNALYEKNIETEIHTQRIETIAVGIGNRIGLPDSEISRLKLLVSLHDIGKINIPENILLKKGKLKKTDWEIIKGHAEIGYRIARSTDEFAHVANEIYSHHEHWDGSGYPRNLKGHQIPLLSRILAIADSFDIMENGSAYKKPMDLLKIIEEFINCKGTQFDPRLVDVLISMLNKQDNSSE